MDNLIERIEDDFNDYVNLFEYIIDNDFEWNNGNINFKGWREIYLEYIDTLDNEDLLDKFATIDIELIYKTFYDNIGLFDEIVEAKYKEVGEQYDKSN